MFAHQCEQFLWTPKFVLRNFRHLKDLTLAYNDRFIESGQTFQKLIKSFSIEEQFTD